MVVQKQRRPRLILLLATALLFQGVLATHRNNSPYPSSSSFSSSLTSSSNANINNNLDIDESFQLKAKKEHKKIAGVDLDAAAEAIEKAVGPRAMAAAKKKADKFLADHKKKKGDKKDKADGMKKKNKNKDDGEEEEEEEVIEISSINNEEEENDIPVNVEDVQNYLSDIWEGIKDLGNDAAIQDQIQNLKESDEIQAQIAHLQSLEDDNPEILDKIEKLREGLDPEKGVQRYEHHLEDYKATEENGFEADVGDSGDNVKLKSQAVVKKHGKHQHQKGGAHEKAEAVGGGQMKNKKLVKQNGQGEQGQGGYRHAKEGGARKKEKDGKDKKHHRVAKKHAVRRKGKGATIRDGHRSTPPVAVPKPVAVPATASAPIEDNGRSPEGPRHRHHHHRKHREDDHKGRQHPGASNGSGPGATLTGDETKGPSPPVHTVPTPPPITLPVEVPLKDATPTEPVVPKPQEPPSSPAPESPKEPVVNEIVPPTTLPPAIVETPSKGPVVVVSYPTSEQEVVSAPVDSQKPSAVNVVKTVFLTEQPLQQQQPEASKDEDQQLNKDREVEQQLSPKPEEISSPAPVQEKQQPADIITVIPDAKPVVQQPGISFSHPAVIETPSTPEPELQEDHHQQPPSDSSTDGSGRPFSYPIDHQLPHFPETNNNGGAQSPMAAPVLELEQKEVPKVKDPAPVSQPPVTGTEPLKVVVEEKKDDDFKVIASSPPPLPSSNENDHQSVAKKPELPIVIPLPPIPHPSPSPSTAEASKPIDSIPVSKPHKEDNDKEDDDEEEDDEEDEDEEDDDDDEVPITPQVGQRVILGNEGARGLSPPSVGLGIVTDRGGSDEAKEGGGSAEEVVEQYGINNINDKNAPAGKDNTAADVYGDEDDKDDEDWGEDDDGDEEVGGGGTVKADKDAAAAGMGAGLHKRQIPAVGALGLKGGVVDNKATALENDPQQRQQQKKDRKAQRQEAMAAAEPIAKAEEKKDTAVDQKAEKKDKAQITEANMIKDDGKKQFKDDNHQRQQQQQQDQQMEKEGVVEAQADQNEENKSKTNKKQQQKEVKQKEEGNDDFVEEEKADIKNEDDNTNPGPAETGDDAVNVDDEVVDFGDDGRQKKGKKNKKGRKNKKNRQGDDENVGQNQNAIADDTVNEDQNAEAAVSPFEVETSKVKKAHKKHKNHRDQDQTQDTLQADAFPAAVDPFAINNSGGTVVHKKGGVHKKDTKDKDADVQQQQDDKSKNEKPGSASPSDNNNNRDPKAIPGAPSVPMSGGGPADRKSPSSPANSSPSGAGPATPPKEGKGATAAGGGGNGYGTVPMFGPAQLDLGSGGVASLRLMLSGQWVVSVSVAVLATVFIYI
ncbi:hypothetical protein F5H01DRAFT_392869 [Linnemannia elongata]|nr:hypothetical protein F5H01DRAFT_392869 [Linnemannia elongata]